MVKRIVVTGGAGFIGSHVCDRLLEEGYDVINIDNMNDFYDRTIKLRNMKQHEKNQHYQFLEIDIRDKEALDALFQSTKIDAVIHLAAMAGVRPSIQNPLLYEEVNVKGTVHILECCARYDVKHVVCASSSSVYGNNKDVPFKESDVVDFAISPYAATKKSCEVMGHVYHHLYDMNVIMLRFFTVYGPRQRPDLAIHKFTKLIIEGKEIPFFGDGSTKRDYTYIDDIVDGVIRSLHHSFNHQSIYEIMNLGESTTISLREMVETIENVVGKKAKLQQLPLQPGDVECTYADVSKAKKIIGYEPTTSFQKGIESFYEWYTETHNWVTQS